MPSIARQLRQPPTIEAIYRGQYFADVAIAIDLSKELDLRSIYYIV